MTPHINAPQGAFAKTVLMPGDPLRAKYIAENFLHLLENFAKSTAPGNPITGQLWFNTTTGSENQLKVYNGTNWVAAGNVKKSTTAPVSSVLGDLWVDTDNQQLNWWSHRKQINSRHWQPFQKHPCNHDVAWH